MSRVVDWLLGRDNLRQRIVKLELEITEKNQHIVVAVGIAKRYRQQVADRDAEIIGREVRIGILETKAKLLQK